jgi:hypothetical protein
MANFLLQHIDQFSQHNITEGKIRKGEFLMGRSQETASQSWQSTHGRKLAPFPPFTRCRFSLAVSTGVVDPV